MAGGTKRRRKAAAPTAAAAAAAATTTTTKAAKSSKASKSSAAAAAAATNNTNNNHNNSPPPCHLLHLLQALRQVASDEECLTDFATSLQDGKALILQLENASSTSTSSSTTMSETTSMTMMMATGGGMDRGSSHSTSGGGGAGGGGGSSTRTVEAAAAAATMQAAATADSSAAAMTCTTAGFYMSMANHLIQRLLKILASSPECTNNTNNNDDASSANAAAAVRVILALLSWAMADCLEKCKWERIGAGGASRFWFARVLLWGTTAATRVLAPLDESALAAVAAATTSRATATGDDDDDNEESSSLSSAAASLSSLVQWPTLIAATLALERWNPQGSSSSGSSSASSFSLQRFWLDLLPALQAQMHSAIIDSNNSTNSSSRSNSTWLEDACTTVDSLLDWTPEEEACWNALLVASGPQDAPAIAAAAAAAAEAEAPSPPAKKRGRRKREQPDEAAAAAAAVAAAALIVPLAATSSLTSPSATTTTAAATAAGVLDTSSPSYIQQLQKQQLSNTFAKLKVTFSMHFTQMDGRLAVKRWSAVAMDWYLRAVPLLLERSRQLLLSQQPDNDNDDDNDNNEQEEECEQFTLTYKKEKEYYYHNVDEDEDAMDAAVEAAAAAAAGDDNRQEIVVAISVPALAVTLVSRWLRILVDVNSKSGSRPPTGSMDAYLRRLRAPPPPPTPSSSSRAGSKKKAATSLSPSSSSSWMNAKLVRTDVRDLAMATAFPLLQVHYEQCLDKMPCVLSSSSSSLAALDLSVWLVNDGGDENSTATTLTNTNTTSFCFYYPHVAQSLDDLSRLASNSVMGASYTEQSDYNAHMDHAMAALVFQLRLSPSSSSSPPPVAVSSSSASSAGASKTQRRGRQAAVAAATTATTTHAPQPRSQYSVMDARLTRYATGKLNDAMIGVKSDENVDKKEEGLHLDLPLPLPVWPVKSTSSSRKTKKADAAAAASAVCTYAGIYAKPTTSGRTHAAAAAAGTSSTTIANSSNGRLSSREKMALYLRAMHHDDEDDDDGDEKMQDGEVSTPPPALAPFLSFLLAIVERCYDTRRLETQLSGTSTTATATKKKAAARPEPTGRKRAASKEAPSRRSKRRRSSKEADASSATAKSQATATDESPDHALAGYSQINATRADLAASVLEAIEQCIQMSAAGQSLGTVFPSIRAALMTSHIFKFIDLGKVLHTVLIRSRSWEPKKTEERSLLDCFFSTGTPLSFSHEEKKLWERHASVSVTLGRGRKDFDSSSTDRSAISDRRLEVFKKIAACSRAPDMREEAWPLWLPTMHRLVLSSNLSHDVSAQDIAADRFLVDGILVSLTNALQNPQVLIPSGKLPATRLCVDEMVPLSLNDARIFLGAVGRLPVDERASSLMSILKALDKGLMDIRSDRKMYSLLCQNGEVSSFVARAISLSIHHALLVTFGRGYHVQLIQVLGNTDFGFPPIWLASDPCRAETSFMGILSDWQSSELPEGMTQIPGAITGAAMAGLHAVLNMALSMGFSSAPSDRCHLLFAAWNALGKTALWGSVPHSVQIPLSVPEDLSSLLTVLRNDICTVSRQIQRDAGIATETSLVRAIDQRITLVSPRVLSENLTNMVSRGSTLLEGLLVKFVPSDDSMEQDIPVEVFALLEALIIYISFAISSLTKPKSNFFDDLALKLNDKRSRGYSTESEVAASEMDSACTHDAKTFALERLGEVCDAFGGVPEHPDWLSDCSLRYNISRADAREISIVAMEALTKVYAVSERLCRRSLGRATGTAGPAANFEDRSLLAQKLFLLAELPCCEEYPDDRNFETDVAALCEVDPKIEVLLLSTSKEKRARLAARELWGPSTAQRVIGKFQDVLGNLGVLSDLGLPEMRAGGEWEVLMSYSLTSASISSSDEKEMTSKSRKVLDYVRCSEKWENVASTALGSLVPVAALLRFSLYGRGRKAHPLSSIEAAVQKYDLIESAPSPSTPVPETTKRAISKTLSIIAQLPAHMEAAAEAVATHLVIEPNSFLDLRGTIAVGHSLDTLSVVVDNFASFSTSAKSAAPFIIDLLAKVLEAYNVDGEGKTEWKRLLSFLGASSSIKGMETIAGVNIDVTAAIELGESKRTGATGRLLHPVAAMIWEDSIKLSESCRRFCGRALSSIASNEICISPTKTGLLDVIFKAFAEAPARCIEKLVRSVGDSSGASDDGSFSDDLCLLLASLLLVGPASGGKLVKLIFTTLEGSLTLNAKEKVNIPALNLLFLYASSNGKLRDVGSTLLEDIGSPGSQIDGPTRLETVQCFISFLQELSSSLKGTSSGSMKVASTLKLPEFAAQRPAACSFITTEGFHEQHWYNCHTCGLIDEKGCCSLCALVCHRGHEVSYARFSSFFCDCGESSAKPTAENRSIASCKCLLPLPHDQLCHAYDFGLSGPASQKDAPAIPQQQVPGDISLSASVCAQIATSSFTGRAQTALKATLEHGQKNGWLTGLFSSMKHEFLTWKATASANDLSKSSVVAYSGLREIVHRERGQEPLKDYQFKKGAAGFSVLCSSQRGTYNVQFPSDQRSTLTKKGLTRSIVVADSRGRLVIAESNQLLFFSGLAMINSRHHYGCTDFSRSTLPITGSKLLDLNVAGMAMSRDNESRIIVWSNDASAVMVLNETASNIVHRIDLVFDTVLADGGKDTVLRGGWLSGSERHPIVLCGHTLRIFDVERPNEPAKPVLSVSVGSATALRDFAVIPGEHQRGVVNNWKIFLLLDSGRLHCVEVSRSDPHEEITVSCSCIGEETLVDLSAYQGTIGEGRHLGFLAQSRVLVYQSSARGATGFVLREDGTIKSRFQLLPEYLKDVGSNSSGFKSCGYRGPYTHWTELGVVQDSDGPSESEYRFKFSCVATRQDNLEPALLCIEVGQTNEICITATPLHPEFSTSSTSVDGFAAFTAPLIQNDSDTSSLSAPRQFSEKVFLCNVMSNGCMGFYTEGEEDKAPDTKSPLGFPVLLFEALKNQSQSEAVQYEGEGISSPETRLKLQRDNDSFFLTPKREGYTLTISTKPTLNDTRKEYPIIVGLRVLFGKTSTNGIPVKFNIQGRVYSTKRGVKAWYPAVLTAGQIALAVRNGYVSLQVGATHESTSSSPIIDAIEVYTIDRSVLDPWLPKKLVSISSMDVYLEDPNILEPRLGSPGSEGLLSSMKSLAGLCKSLGQKTAEISDKSLLKDIVQSTALGCDQTIKDSIEKLMKAFEPENESFVDDGKVAACMSFLSKCDTALSNPPSTEPVDSLVFWHHNTDLLRECLRMASAIARQRPTEYIHALKNNGSALGSIAAPAAKHVTSCVSLFLAHEGLVPDFVELCLVEMAVAGGFGSEFSSQSHLGRFATLRCVLNSQNNIVEEQTCTSIERFCQKYRAPKSLGDEFDLFAAGSMVARYKCDRCSVWLKKVRYSLLNDHHPYDLCQECFQKGTDFATQNGFKEHVDVVINGETVGEDPFGRMTCAEVKLIVPVPVHERATAMDRSGGGGEEVFHRQQLYDEFIDKLFNGLLSLILSAVREGTQAPNHLIKLAVGLASMSDGERKLDRKKRLSKELCFCLSSVLKIGDKSKATNAAMDRDVVSFLRALSQLVVFDSNARRYLTMPHAASDITSYKGSPPFVCDAHKIPLKMRKGPAPDDRRFMVCGENKCNFFVWFDQMGETVESESDFDDPTAVHVWKLMSSRSRTDTKPLHARLCEFLDGRYPKSGSSTSDNGETRSLLSKYTYSKAQADIADGVLCSRERLLSQTPSDFAGVCSALPPNKAVEEGSFEHGGIEAAMELLTLVASPEEDSSACWFPLLCRLILAEGRSSRRQLAKLSLLRLCGRKHDKYLQVRDHHFFGFHLKKVVSLSSELLEAAAVVKEKARQCGPNWKSAMRTDWSNAKGVEFLGVHDLVPFVPNLANDEAIIKVLGDLVNAAKKRGDNWRRFCLFGSPALGSGERIAASLLRAPPVVTIFSLATLLSAESQQRALKLLDLALAPVKEMKTAATAGQESTPSNQLVQQHFVPSGSKSFSSLSDILKLNVDDVHAFTSQFVVHGETAELRQVACSVAMKLCGGSLLDQKSVGSILTRLILQSLREVGELGKNGIEILGLISELLKRNIDVAAVNIDVPGNAELIRTHWMQQMLALRHDRANEEYLLCETRSGSSSQKRRYELACCVHCHGQCHGAPPNTPRSKRSDKGEGRSGRTGQENPPATSQASPKTPWLPEQVSGFARGRLDAAREVHSSDAFCSYVTLKYRLAISEIHVEVHDPRGRYVKTINVYATPRPVNDSSVLKSDSYATCWQPIGTLSLARGASRASHTLKIPVLAANLKIEYTDFYERPGGSKAADGSMVVHCPRCTRAVVNNAGVCNNCGEVAFQCRKCRHINYDRLDAFLCVECGYCASGSFSYEITAGMASNAIAITNDEEFERAQQMFEISSRLYDDLRGALKDQYAALTRGSKKGSESERGFACLTVKRAFAGLLPLGPGEKEDELNLTLETMGKQGSVVRTVAGPSGASNSSRSSPRNRAASLLRLSSSSTSNAPRRRSGDMVIRQIGRDLHIDDDDSELLGFLEGSGGLARAVGLDPSDPLSRLLASVQNRREQRQTTSGRGEGSSTRASTTRDAGAAATSQTASGAKLLSSKEHLEICERLHVLLREAERESFQLSARINAWRRLESDSLTSVGFDESMALPQFTPCHCGTCAGSLAVHLLVVWVRLFQTDPKSVKITKEMIHALLLEDGHGPKGLLEWKRAALREIAQKSTTGAPLILEALRLRLTMGDVNAAEILGKILETVKEGPFAQQFLDLTTEVLETNQTRW